ncbi:uncharacterized protein LOC131803862 isoform X2 [Musca domestica]|uniref:Uncharacterized protein LOC131803862 isoform X2 n=1 Tax=Musca domestica TaxID=7370 RepID=A0ABM3V782_MUSDO|nr:uncharacterized protein LOC131803862 isoform X2 [Musca domestica]
MSIQNSFIFIILLLGCHERILAISEDFPTNSISDENLKQGLSDLSLDDLRVLNKLIDLEKKLYDDYDYDSSYNRNTDKDQHINPDVISYPDLYDATEEEAEQKTMKTDNNLLNYDLIDKSRDDTPIELDDQYQRTKREEQANEAYIQQLHESFPRDTDESDDLNLNNFPSLKELVRVKRN